MCICSSALATDEVAFIVDKSVYNACKTNILLYKADVEARFPVHLRICNEAPFESYSPQQMRSYIQEQYATNNITGVVLVGQIQYSLWRQSFPWDNYGINSNYYEDLDGTFSDTDGDGYQDYHGWGTKIGPEIWCCWMRPPADDNINALKTFLAKTHDYYNGRVLFNHRALIADHADFDAAMHSGFDQYGHLSQLYGSSNVDVLGEGASLFRAADYLRLLQSNLYEICDPMSHANAWLQCSDDGDVSNTDAKNLAGGAIITLIYGCHSAAFNEAPSNNIAQMYVFGHSIGQASAGTSWSYGMGEKYAVYDVLKAGGYLGQGWLNMQKLVNSPSYLRLSYGQNMDIYRQMWGHNLIGNPFLYTNYDPSKLIGGTISGKVTDSGEKPVAGAIIGFKDSPKATADALFYVTTDSDGNYSSPETAAGTYYVAAFKDGYQPTDDTTIYVENNVSSSVNFQLNTQDAANIALGLKTVSAPYTGTDIPMLALDGNLSTCWSSSASEGSQYYYIEFPNPTDVDSITIFRNITATEISGDYWIDVMSDGSPLNPGSWDNNPSVTRVYSAEGTLYGYNSGANCPVDPINLGLSNIRGIRIGISTPNSIKIPEIRIYGSTEFTKITGQLKDANGNPVSGATVGIKKSVYASANADYYATTDANGNYTSPDLPDGQFYIAAWKDGWTPTKDFIVSCTAPSQITQNLQFDKPEATNIALNLSTVSASKGNSATTAIDGRLDTNWQTSSSDANEVIYYYVDLVGQADISSITAFHYYSVMNGNFWIDAMTEGEPMNPNSWNNNSTVSRVYTAENASRGYSVQDTKISPVRVDLSHVRGLRIGMSAQSNYGLSEFRIHGTVKYAKISGQVTDMSGNPVSGAIVALKTSPKASADAWNYYVTDSNGNYTGSNIPIGKFYASAWKDGFTPTDDSIVNTQPDSTTVHNIQFDRAAGANVTLYSPSVSASGAICGLPTYNYTPSAAVDGKLTAAGWTASKTPDPSCYYVDLRRATDISDIVLYRAARKDAQNKLFKDDYKIDVMRDGDPLIGSSWVNNPNVETVYYASQTTHGYVSTSTCIDPIRLSLTGIKGIRVSFDKSNASASSYELTEFKFTMSIITDLLCYQVK